MVILYTLSYDNVSSADRKHTKYRLNPTYYWFTLKRLAHNVQYDVYRMFNILQYVVSKSLSCVVGLMDWKSEVIYFQA